jgi:hypothetical protein
MPSARIREAEFWAKNVVDLARHNPPQRRPFLEIYRRLLGRDVSIF